MIRAGARLIGTIAAGAAIDRMAQQPKPEDKGTQRPNGAFSTGDAKLQALAESVKVAKDGPNPLMHGAQSQMGNRKDVFKKFGTIVANPQLIPEHASHAMEDLKSEAQVIKGAVKVAQGAEITSSDVARLGKASVEETRNKLADGAKTLFAVATTSKPSVENLANSVAERAAYEMKSTAFGLGLSQGVATTVGMFPHPAAKVASAFIRSTGQLAAGNKLSESMRQTSDETHGPIGTEAKAILREKANDV
jgi:hypothetical protein